MLFQPFLSILFGTNYDRRKPLCWANIPYGGFFCLSHLFYSFLPSPSFPSSEVNLNFKSLVRILLGTNYERRKPLCWPKIPYGGIFRLSHQRDRRNKGVKKNKRRQIKQVSLYYARISSHIRQIYHVIGLALLLWLKINFRKRIITNDF